MIEFNGYLTGKAKKHFIKCWGSMGRKIIVPVILGVLCPIVLYMIYSSNWKSLIVIVVCAVIVLLSTFIPQKEKTIQAQIPKQIFIKNNSITCITDAESDSRLIDDVKLVREYDEFYELIFPFGKLSAKFICQKSLLTRGTFAEFENLFAGKIERNISN